MRRAVLAAGLILSMAFSVSGQLVETVILTGVSNPLINNGLVVDRSGVIFASQIFSQTGQLNGTKVFRIEPNGETSTVGISFAQPAGLAIDSRGRLYIANFIGNRISRVELDGSISTFASSGFDLPAGMVFDDDGTLYVTNFGNNTIVKVDTSGVTSSFASGGSLSSPVGIAFDASGVLYVSNLASSSISRIDSTGRVTTLVSNVAGDLGFMAYVRGFLYVTSTTTSEVFRISLSGDVTRFAGTGVAGSTDGPIAEAGFTNPDGIAASPTGDTLYVSENNSHRLRRIVGLMTTSVDPDEIPGQKGSLQFELYPNPSRGLATINIESSNGADAARVVVADVMGRVVQRIDASIPPGSSRIDLTMPEFSPGMYWVHVQTGDGFSDRHAMTIFR